MPATKILTGPRAKISIDNTSNGGKISDIGIFSSVSYGLTYETANADILGRYSTGGIEFVGQSPINISCSGFRSVQHGPHVVASVPRLVDLLSTQYIQITIVDRQTNLIVARFKDCRPLGFSTDIQAKSLATLSVNFIGITMDDEDGVGIEDPNSTSLP